MNNKARVIRSRALIENKDGVISDTRTGEMIQGEPNIFSIADKLAERGTEMLQRVKEIRETCGGDVKVTETFEIIEEME